MREPTTTWLGEVLALLLDDGVELERRTPFCATFLISGQE